MPTDEDDADREEPGARPCPVCDALLLREPLYDGDDLRIALRCPDHGIAAIIDPFS